MGGCSDLFDLSGLVSVVTGGSRGIGRSIATGLAAAGSDVVIASRKLDNCRATADHIARETGRRALPVAYHSGRWEDSDRLVTSVYVEFGRCDVLVNNAAIALPYEDLPTIGEALWDKTQEVNTKGPFRLSALFAHRMYEAGGGSIINVSSGAAKAPRADNVIYAITKAGLDALALGLIARFSPTVRINTIYPGATATDMLGEWTESESYLKQTGLDRLGQPEDFVGAAVFLAGAASQYVTGATIPVA